MCSAPTTEPPFRREWDLLTRQFATASTSTDDLRLLMAALNRLSVAALAADQTGRYVAVNRAAVTMIGYSVDQLESMSVWDLTPQVDAATGRRLWAAFLASGAQTGTYTIRAAHGRIDVVYDARANVLPGVHL